MKKEHQYFVYILTNKNNRVLYTGITNCLETRLQQHIKKENPKSFSAHYNCHKLVYWEEFQYVTDAIAREKQIKKGSRDKKLSLVDSFNPQWKDLASDWFC